MTRADIRRQTGQFPAPTIPAAATVVQCPTPVVVSSIPAIHQWPACESVSDRAVAGSTVVPLMRRDVRRTLRSRTPRRTGRRWGGRNLPVVVSLFLSAVVAGGVFAAALDALSPPPIASPIPSPSVTGGVVTGVNVADVDVAAIPYVSLPDPDAQLTVPAGVVEKVQTARDVLTQVDGIELSGVDVSAVDALVKLLEEEPVVVATVLEGGGATESDLVAGEGSSGGLDGSLTDLVRFETDLEERLVDVRALLDAQPAVTVAFPLTTDEIGEVVSVASTAYKAPAASNGQIPSNQLCPVGVGTHRLRCDAAFQFAQLNDAFAHKFGYRIGITDSYRTLASQFAVKAEKPGLAAVPGTSNHGWGLALDLNGAVAHFGTAERAWLVANGPSFGWIAPGWANAGGSKPEPWHYEFVGVDGGDVSLPDRVVEDPSLLDDSRVDKAVSRWGFRVPTIEASPASER